MPRRDGTGPMGMGPMSGRGAGFCNANGVPNDMHQPCFGRGLGCGSRKAFSGSRNQATYLDNQLQLLKKRLSELEAKS